MANILHLDENDVASRAMRGVLSRVGHRCVSITSAPDAWTALRDLVKFDLAFVELKLKGENGIAFIGRLREDNFLQRLPVVVYTSVGDQAVVKKALSLRIQNYLIKPYNDASIYAEISKANANPWRNMFFEEEKSFCAQMGFTASDLRTMRERLLDEIDRLCALLPLFNVDDRQKEISASIDTLCGNSEAAGYWGLVDLLGKLKTKIEIKRWEELPPFIYDLEYAKKLLFCQIHPEHLPEGFLSETERKEKEESRERARWMDTDIRISGPLVQRSGVLAQLDGLPGFPVMDTVAASFLMFADGQASNLANIAELVSRDPGLTAQVLVAVNKIEREDMNVVEDPRTAISLLGEIRLSSLARTLPIIDERHMQMPPVTWPHYWMFLMGVARLAQYTCRNLEMEDIEPNAYTAGLLHDLGKLLLLKLYPFGFQAIVAHAKSHSEPLHVAEQSYIDITTREMAIHFSELSGLPECYRNVIRWVETPQDSAADAELVAAVSLARFLCLHNHVGYCGDTPHDEAPCIEETPAWQILRTRIFPSFNIRQFEAQAHAFSKELRQELLGRLR
ncbi:MAG: HDOD domain-containing protein [Opitutaceae bacterium]|jgi:CheY-like chemotaxis protein/HD-like signal output (HDOD) protein